MFERLTAARANFPSTPCVYIQADPARYPFRIGKASEGLEGRYRGGTGYAIDAAMHGSGNLVFVAAVPKELCERLRASSSGGVGEVCRTTTMGRGRHPLGGCGWCTRAQRQDLMASGSSTALALTRGLHNFAVQRTGGSRCAPPGR